MACSFLPNLKDGDMGDRHSPVVKVCVPCQERGPHPEGSLEVLRLGSDEERMTCSRHFSGNPRSLKWNVAEPGSRTRKQASRY